MSRTNPHVVYLPKAAIARAVRRFKTPFFIYEEKRIRANCRRFRDAFRRHFPTFTPLFAVKANTNPAVLKIVFSEGFGADASSEAEAWITKKLGGWGLYTGNYTTEPEFRFVQRCGLRLNLDDASMLPTVARLGMPRFLSFRINPGISRGGMTSLLLAGPNAKYGVPHEEAVDAYRRAKALGVTRFGIHMMTGSNVLNEGYFAEVTARLLAIAGRVKRALGIEFDCINIGGGFGVPYRPTEKTLALARIAKELRRVFDARCAEFGMREPTLMAEPGRLITADAGWLVGRVAVVKKSYKTFAGIDAGMNDLPRPAIYDAYHHITVLNRPLGGRKARVNIVGRLCENNDQFAKDRLLPPVGVGDTIVIHNAGAHAYAMGHNYNNRLRSAEYLITRAGALKKVRRAETIADLFRTTGLR
ncbi:MAG: diaminopimelate decarboxylase [Kiritimatiellae bacterium]|nr:diaminopimelate decarboxylase [Kiritimatiellia bacterium]